MSPLELVDDRFEKLATALRASRPVASESLRERVRALGEPEPARERWSFRLPGRPVVLGLAAAALLASFVAAGITGLGGSDRKSVSAGVSRQPLEQGTATTKGGSTFKPTLQRRLDKAPVLSGRAPTPAYDSFGAPAAGRLQRYDATLRLRVKDVDALSNAAKRAMSLTRGLGGYVASVQYSTSGSKRGGATLVLRVPVANVQSALGELTTLGTILQQRTGILDVTRRASRESRQIAQLERELAAADSAQAPGIRERLKTLRVKHARLLKSVRLAKITLALTTPAKKAAAAPTRFDRTLDDAGAVLLRELEILLYALVVAGPLLLLGGAGIAAARAVRRRADGRLLASERP